MSALFKDAVLSLYDLTEVCVSLGTVILQPQCLYRFDVLSAILLLTC